MLEIYRTGKVSVAFEPMKIDDVVEITNHFRAGQYMVDTITDPITTIWLRKLHHKLFRGTRADQEGTLHIGEYKQIGNSVCVPVIKRIAEKIKEIC